TTRHATSNAPSRRVRLRSRAQLSEVRGRQRPDGIHEPLELREAAVLARRVHADANDDLHNLGPRDAAHPGASAGLLDLEIGALLEVERCVEKFGVRAARPGLTVVGEEEEGADVLDGGHLQRLPVGSLDLCESAAVAAASAGPAAAHRSPPASPATGTGTTMRASSSTCPGVRSPRRSCFPPAALNSTMNSSRITINARMV